MTDDVIDRASTTPAKMRDRVLDTARAAIADDGERGTAYGSPQRNFERIAQLWSAVSQRAEPYTVAEVALYLAMVKVSRLCTTPEHADSWVDIAGYAALGAEVALPADALLPEKDVEPILTLPDYYTSGEAASNMAAAAVNPLTGLPVPSSPPPVPVPKFHPYSVPTPVGVEVPEVQGPETGGREVWERVRAGDVIEVDPASTVNIPVLGGVVFSPWHRGPQRVAVVSSEIDSAGDVHLRTADLGVDILDILSDTRLLWWSTYWRVSRWPAAEAGTGTDADADDEGTV